jgi:Uma2 family endonuclease
MIDLIKELRQRPDLKGIVKTLQDMLEGEERLRQEFYNTIDEGDKAEFINGEMIMHSPVRLEHADCSRLLSNLLMNYCLRYGVGEVYVEKIMVQLSRNSYEPDIVFFNKNKLSSFRPEQMLFPAPDFIAEILSPSTEKNDRGIKFEDYALHGVTEYWLVDPVKKIIEQYLLGNTGYQLEFKGNNGIVTSKAIKGFAVDTRAVFDKEENMKAIRQLMA